MAKPSVLMALQRARLALSATHRCVCTDRPDLPLTSATSWTIDNADEIALIDKALAELGATHHIGDECIGRSMSRARRHS